MILKEIAARMKLVEGDSVECMSGLLDPVDVDRKSTRLNSSH